MARILLILASFILLSSFASISIASISIIAENDGYVISINRNPTCLEKPKLTHLRVYWHDIYGGSNPTAVQIVKPPTTNASVIDFGSISMIDDPLTDAPELNSTLVGRAQGFYGQASQEGVAIIMVMNFVFINGKFNGSTITILGRNSIFLDVREMPVIGGTGAFRLATGYALVTTSKNDAPTSMYDATIEYNIYVSHY